MNHILLPALKGLLKKVRAIAQQASGTPVTEAIGFFDLSGSTRLKLSKGHTRGTIAALRFTAAASEVVAQCNGVLVKELGDGILCRFADPLEACKAAINLKVACRQLGLLASFGLTIGRIVRYQKVTGAEDIFGDAVDRCSRIQSLTYPDQILIDRPLHETVRSYLLEYPDIVVGDMFRSEAKGFELLELWEVSTRQLGLVNRIMTPFRIHAGGRPSIEEKVQFVNCAQSEVLEIGTGLTAFAKYFTGQKPKEFRNHIRDLLKRGVTVKCYALDPGYKPAASCLAEEGDDRYAQDILRAREMILAERRRFLVQGYGGQLEYYSYRAIPRFHCICVDGLDPTNARMLFQPYLLGLSRAECPVYELSRVANHELFDKYWAAIYDLQTRGTEVPD